MSNGSLGSRYFLGVVNERTSFASCASAFKSAGLVISWNELLTKKLPMFLSRLNEMSGGGEKIVPVSGSFWSNLIKVFKNNGFN